MKEIVFPNVGILHLGIIEWGIREADHPETLFLAPEVYLIARRLVSVHCCDSDGEYFVLLSTKVRPTIPFERPKEAFLDLQDVVEC